MVAAVAAAEAPNATAVRAPPAPSWIRVPLMAGDRVRGFSFVATAWVTSGVASSRSASASSESPGRRFRCCFFTLAFPFPAFMAMPAATAATATAATAIPPRPAGLRAASCSCCAAWPAVSPPRRISVAFALGVAVELGV